MPLRLFAFHHLNIAYSAISEEDRPKIVERCYWPLLRLARKLKLPFGIELTGYTLETIAEIDPAWLAELRSLISDGNCELIGSGYAQIIGPLVPSKVNEQNLRLGHEVYEKLLGKRPKIALLNEQAYSSGLVPIYRNAGYEAIIMEWNNPYKAHPEWDSEWRYFPQVAQGSAKAQLPLIWNKSITFQKFQRYAHGELELDEILAYLKSHVSSQNRALALYGNDVEIFDFRPGRYMTEAPIATESEWIRIERLYAAITAAPEFQLIPPSGVLELGQEPDASNVLKLQSAAHPIPVKKQNKYNVTRWAVTGRGDLDINTRCWRLYESLQVSTEASNEDWRELCYLWGSDFRTHITEARWEKYLERLASFQRRWPDRRSQYTYVSGKPAATSSGVEVTKNKRFIEIDGSRLKIRFNYLKGLALDSFSDVSVNTQALCGTLHHGYYDDIAYSADYYSGHLIFESPGFPKITDLIAVQPVIIKSDNTVEVSATIPSRYGPIEKRWLVNDNQGEVILSYSLNWHGSVVGSLRIGCLTLFPNAFDQHSLHYATHNGGEEKEYFPLVGDNFNHGQHVSFLVSANQAIGMTNGLIEIGDATKRCNLMIDKKLAAVVGLVSNNKIKNTNLTRLFVTAMEIDDTFRSSTLNNFRIELKFSF